MLYYFHTLKKPLTISIKTCPNTQVHTIFNKKDAEGNIVNTVNKDINNLLDSLGLSYMHRKSDNTHSDVEVVIEQIKDSYIQN